MIRTQVLLQEVQLRYLKELSRETGRSVSALVREAVDQMRENEASPTDRLRSLIGAFEDDRGDVSERHDHYFVESILP